MKQQNIFLSFTLFLLLVIFSQTIAAQQLVQKYNKLLDRVEFYNAYGNMIGYAKVNKLLNRVEYYDATGNLLKTETHNNLLDRTESRDRYGNQQGYEKNNDISSISSCHRANFIL